MKRLFIILSMAMIVLLANAKTPQIAVLQLFDGRYNKEKTVRTSISKANGMCHRLLWVTDNPAIIKTISETLSKDAQNAARFYEQTGEGGKSTLIKITVNEDTIDIGFQQDTSGKNASLFIRGPENAFR